MKKFEHGGDVYGNKNVLLDFSVNTNPLGMPEEIRRALVSHTDGYSRYPDPECRELRAAIARRENVPADFILCGNGAADLIYRLCYASRPRKALTLAPTFSEYERALQAAGCQAGHHILTADDGFELTEDIMENIRPGVEMIFLCNPNNPTGRLINDGLLIKILSRAKEIDATVLIDECFLDFTAGGSGSAEDSCGTAGSPSAKKFLKDFPNLCILKAFTKMYSMAGLRLGYILTANKTLLEKINAAGQCWSVSVPAQTAGLAALSLDGWVSRTRALVKGERRFLSENLNGLGLTVFPGDANFLLFRSEKPLYRPLLKQGILIRRCENFTGLDETYYRICVKTREDNLQLLHALRFVLKTEGI